MARLKHQQKRLVFGTAEEGVMKGLKAFSETSDGKHFVHPAPDGRGFTFGRGLAYCEYEGEGLPEGEGKELTFDLRVVLIEDHTIELQMAVKGSGRHFRFRFENLPDPKLEPDSECFFYDGKKLSAFRHTDGRLVNENIHLKALYDFLVKVEFYLPQNAYHLLWACIRQFEDRKRRIDDYEKIMANLELQFKPLLKFDRFKEVDSKTVHGVEITTLEPIESGRRPGSKGTRKLSDREISQRAQRRSKIIDAMRTASRNDNKSELASIIGISVPTLRSWLRSEGVKSEEDFDELIREAESH